jgi:apolipoprotein N-acyltransferase
MRENKIIKSLGFLVSVVANEPHHQIVAVIFFCFFFFFLGIFVWWLAVVTDKIKYHFVFDFILVKKLNLGQNLKK